MKLVGRIPVEPLDDERMTNLERRIVAGAADAAERPVRGAGRAYAMVFAGVAAAAACCIALGWKLGGETGAPVVGAAEPVRVDTALERTTLDIGDARITSDPMTAFVITRPGSGVLVDMARGKVELEVGKRGDRDPLVVRAGDTDVLVIGTRFSVDYGDGTGTAIVVVTEGVVKVVRQQQEVRVAAGQTWQVTGVVVAVTGGPASGTGGTGTGVGGTGVGAIGGSGTGVGGGGPTGTGVDGTGATTGVTAGGTIASNGIAIRTGTGPDVLRDRTARVPGQDEGPGTNAGAANGGRSVGPPSTGATGTAPVNPRDPKGPVTIGTGSGAIVLKPGEDPKNPHRNVTRLVARQPLEPAMPTSETVAAKAIAAYYAIIRENRGQDEARAYYSIAVTQYLELKRSTDALKTLDAYFRRFGSKEYPQHASARWLRVRILCGTVVDATCKHAAQAYVDAHPGTPAASVAELITLTD